MCEEIEIWACCSSENVDASIAFGVSAKADIEPIEDVGIDWIFEGLSDSFWENYYVFGPYIESATASLKNNSELSPHQVLFNIFGKFTVIYEVNGKKTELDFDVDINSLVYTLLESAL